MIAHHRPETIQVSAQLIVNSEINKVPFRINGGDDWEILIELFSGGTRQPWFIETYKMLVSFRWEFVF